MLRARYYSICSQHIPDITNEIWGRNVSARRGDERASTSYRPRVEGTGAALFERLVRELEERISN